jgi:hypothetical protein
MHKRNYALVVGVIIASGCSLSSNYRSDGPCQGFHQNPQACERAHGNSLAVGKVQVGQPLATVRSAMGRDPERREANAESEVWWYLTDYGSQIYTGIVFKQGVVAEIKQSSVR